MAIGKEEFGLDFPALSIVFIKRVLPLFFVLIFSSPNSYAKNPDYCEDLYKRLDNRVSFGAPHVSKVASAIQKRNDIFLGSFRSFFKPVEVPSEVHSGEVGIQTASDIQALNKMGVGFHTSNDQTYLFDNVNTQQITKLYLDLFGGANYGKVFNVDKLPSPGSARGPNTKALLHPEMVAYKAKLEHMGYRLTIDTSTPFTGTEAYQWSYTKVVALRPDSTWQTFLHEFQHVEFAHFLQADFARLQVGVASGKSLREILPLDIVRTIGENRVQRMQDLLEKGLPELAVNETLSVDEELRSMGFRRYIPFLGTGTEKYALCHQITELNAIVEKGGALSRTQATSLAQAKRRYVSLLAFDVGGPVAVAGAIVGTNVVAESYLRDRDHDPNSYAQIAYDQKGNVIGQRPEGTWVYLRRDR